MIGQDDFQFISRFDTQDPKSREAVVKENPQQLAKTFLNLLSSISKETTIQYLLTLLDDILQVNKNIQKILMSRTNIFIFVNQRYLFPSNIVLGG